MLCSAPLGHVASLSTQKFSSNVMEACLERALPEVQVRDFVKVSRLCGCLAWLRGLLQRLEIFSVLAGLA